VVVHLVFVTMRFGGLSEPFPISAEKPKSARERYIRVAAIEIVISEGIRNIESNASLRFRNKKTAGGISAIVAMKR